MYIKFKHEKIKKRYEKKKKNYYQKINLIFYQHFL